MTGIKNIGTRCMLARITLGKSVGICKCHIEPTCWRCSTMMLLLGSMPAKHMMSEADRNELATILAQEEANHDA